MVWTAGPRTGGRRPTGARFQGTAAPSSVSVKVCMYESGGWQLNSCDALTQQRPCHMLFFWPRIPAKRLCDWLCARLANVGPSAKANRPAGMTPKVSVQETEHVSIVVRYEYNEGIEWFGRASRVKHGPCTDLSNVGIESGVMRKALAHSSSFSILVRVFDPEADSIERGTNCFSIKQKVSPVYLLQVFAKASIPFGIPGLAFLETTKLMTCRIKTF